MYEYFDHHDPNLLSGTVVGSSVRSTNYSGLATMANSTNHSHEDNLKLSNFYLHGLSDHSKQEFNCQLMEGVFKEQEQSLEQPNWSNGVHEMKEITPSNNHQYHQEQIEKNQNHIAITPHSPFSTDFLNLLQMNHHNAEKTTNYQPSLDIFGEICINENGIGLYDPQSHLNFSSQSSMFRDLYDASPSQNYGLIGSKDGSNLFLGKDDQEIIGDIFQEDNTGMGKTPVIERKERGHFATERQRREQLNEKYSLLKSLVPNPTKSDRASIVGDAINYIKELQRTVEELKTLVDQKRHGKQKKRKIEDGAADMESSSMKPTGALLRCSWLERKSKETIVDVRIVHDEVNMKLTQRKRTNCLLYVSKILHELQLELVHLAGGNIGDSYIFMFNTKICEGSSLYAGAIAEKVLEAADMQYSTVATSL